MRPTVLSLLLGPFLYQSPTWGQAPQVKSQAPGFYRFMVGDIEVTALNDGVISYRTAKLLPTVPPVEALAAYRHSLELYPRRFNSVLGAARAARAAGEQALADRFYRELIAIAAPGSTRPGLKEARR